jgi:hypothetical protein
MYCPRCSGTAVEGQRFCRGCGMNLGIIIDALEGRRGTIDFEVLKRDLRELGANLRAGFSQAGEGLSKTSRLDSGQNINRSSGRSSDRPPDAQVAAQVEAAVASIRKAGWSREFDRALHKVKAAHSRIYSLQQSVLSLLGGGAIMAAWYYILNAASTSGLIDSIEGIISRESGYQVIGIAPVTRTLWLLGLIPIASGIGHLINAIFFVPKNIADPDPHQIEPQRQPIIITPEPPVTPPPSVTEETTVRFRE